MIHHHQSSPTHSAVAAPSTFPRQASTGRHMAQRGQGTLLLVHGGSATCKEGRPGCLLGFACERVTSRSGGTCEGLPEGKSGEVWALLRLFCSGVQM